MLEVKKWQIPTTVQMLARVLPIARDVHPQPRIQLTIYLVGCYGLLQDPLLSKSVIFQQRRSFAIRINHFSVTTYASLTKGTRDADKEREDDQTAHDHESEDPLEGNDTCRHLRKCES